MVIDTYLAELAKALAANPIPSFSAGASGYFSRPRKTLDPALFDGDHIKPEVASRTQDTLFRFWRFRGYNYPEAWTTVWLAGSGVSYQWAGDRGNGDLDVLMGINWPLFYQHNVTWGFTPIDEMTEYLDTELRTYLWPRTEHTVFGGKEFEQTFFVNAGMDSSDITVISPYAAYNLTHDRWDVRPPAPEQTAYYHRGDPDWEPYAERDLDLTRWVVQQLQHALGRLPQGGGPQWVNAMSTASHIVDYAVALMTDIHGHRRDAFKPGGQGYWDFNNWRWQMAKKNGVVKVLAAIEQAHTQAKEATEKKQYGQVLPEAHDLVTRAALQYRDAS